MVRVVTVLFAASAACASVHSTVTVTPEGAGGAHPSVPPGRLVPVYYALPPPFPYRELAAVHVTAEGSHAHLDELLSEAETRAQRLGADALILHDVRTTAYYVRQQAWRTCTMYGPGGRPLPYDCPTPVNVLSVRSALEASAVRRDPTAPPPDVLWRPPPPLGALGTPGPPPPPPEATLPDLDETLAPPP